MQDVVDVTYVDDEAVMATAHSPKSLRMAAEIIVDTFSDVFKSSGFRINWNKGKTEAMIRLRGKHSKHVLESLRTPDGSKVLKVPGHDHQCLHFTEEYKHLGGIVTKSGSIIREAVHRSSSAMSSS